MNEFPSAGQYQEALQFPETAFAAPHLKRAVPELTPLGLPRLISGASAVVARLETATGPVAVRLFTRAPGGIDRHYAALERFVREQDVPGVRPFHYESGGVLVEGRRYPLLESSWSTGVPLHRFVADHRKEPDVLRALAERLRTTVEALEALGAAHGDLQHGNVLVEASGEVVLVDFDAFIVPGAGRRVHPEVGHRNYAHPDRTPTTPGVVLDRFPLLVLYTALHALALDPGLWSAFDTGENVLFTATDFLDPDASPLLAQLAAHEALGPLVAGLRLACRLPPQRTPRLADVLRGTLPDAPVERAVSTAGGRRVRAVAVVLALFGLALLAPWPVAMIVVAGALGLAAFSYARAPLVVRRRRLAREVRRFAADRADALRLAAGVAAEREHVAGHLDEARAARLHELRREALGACLARHLVGEAAEGARLSHKQVVRLKAAGIRSAAQVTEAHLRDVPELGPDSRARVTRWRDDLAQRYDASLPARLSSGEERRLERMRQHRLDELAAEHARFDERARALSVEEARLQMRRSGLPAYGLARHVAVLLGFAAPPTMPDAVPPRPTAGRENARSTAPDEDPWWQA